MRPCGARELAGRQHNKANIMRTFLYAIRNILWLVSIGSAVSFLILVSVTKEKTLAMNNMPRTPNTERVIWINDNHTTILWSLGVTAFLCPFAAFTIPRKIA